MTDSIRDTPYGRSRLKLIDSGVLKESGGRLLFEKDHLFSSPSAAAVAVMGRSANGWNAWRSKAGNTLDELKRQGQDE